MEVRDSNTGIYFIIFAISVMQNLKQYQKMQNKL